MNKLSVAESIRMIGHLLEHHGTTLAYARDKNGQACLTLHKEACSWCLVGAVYTVGRRVGESDAISMAIEDQVLGIPRENLCALWDKSSYSERLAICKKLQNYEG